MPDQHAVAAEFRVVDPASTDAQWALAKYFAFLDEVFPTGFDPGDVDADLPALRPPDGAFVVAYVDDVAVACGAAQTIEPGVGEIKRMWVTDDMRGVGLGKGMVAELERIIGEMGHTIIRLDTNSTLTPAITMYERLGYRQIDDYNHNPYAHHWFEKQISSAGGRWSGYAHRQWE